MAQGFLFVLHCVERALQYVDGIIYMHADRGCARTVEYPCLCTPARHDDLEFRMPEGLRGSVNLYRLNMCTKTQKASVENGNSRFT